MLRLPAHRDAVTRALTAGRRFSATAGLAAEASDRLAIVLEEWVMNVVEHGDPHPASRIILRLARGADGVRIVVTDAGVAFDPRSGPAPAPDPERGGGAGLGLILTWCRVERYRRQRGRNHLWLVFPPT